ncbi:HlyC/CorC family transporter [Clostridium fermenticellae]|uniref:HlyC/CorC family transporter n=1 Tax=Clostridium fermenticellae TaxID=2068654 RepID=A0A386H6X8_9CLOT|nr:hemolysin family protein [Clostridium fermenticellae]AYD41482.1 HlyC/CorC family transporter [Clostridium fermenticellae]
MIYFMNFIIVILLIFMNGFFVATEFSMVKVRKSRIETLVLEGSKGAKHTLKVINDLNSYLSACQLGITLASLGLGWIGEPAVSDAVMPFFKFLGINGVSAYSISFVLGFAIITTFHIVLGELSPKSIAIINTEKIAIYTALPLIIFYRITYPIMWLFNCSTNIVVKIFGISQTNEGEDFYTDDEIKLLVEESYKHGLIDKTELTLVDNIFDFSDKTVKEVMIPRTDMACIFMEDSFDKIIEKTLHEQLTRYPVCKGNKDNIVGFIHIKDLYRQKIEGNSTNIEKIIRDIKFVPESLSISELFKMFQKDRSQLAIVIDEYGGTYGLVTIEDILEEIVGDIQDEFDEETSEIVRTDDNGYIVDGKLSIDDINELLNIDIDSDNIDTVGGWVYSNLKLYPQVNDEVIYKNYKFTVLKCNRKRVSRILIENKINVNKNQSK